MSSRVRFVASPPRAPPGAESAFDMRRGAACRSHERAEEDAGGGIPRKRNSYEKHGASRERLRPKRAVGARGPIGRVRGGIDRRAGCASGVCGWGSVPRVPPPPRAPGGAASAFDVGAAWRARRASAKEGAGGEMPGPSGRATLLRSRADAGQSGGRAAASWFVSSPTSRRAPAGAASVA